MFEESFVDTARGYQIWNDVRRRKPRDWIALDDDFKDWPTWCLNRLVKTNEVDGISDPAVLRDLRRKLASMCGGTAPAIEHDPTEGMSG